MEWQGLDPAPAPAPTGGWHRAAVLALGVLVAAGAWLRFNDRIADAIPALAAPEGTGAAGPMVGGLIELALLPQSATQSALAAMELPPGDAARLGDALRRHRLRLVRLPLFDTGALPDPGAGRMVAVSAGGYTRTLRLSRQPTVVTVPIATAGTVAFRTSSADGVAIGALTMNGPMILPPLGREQSLLMGIIAQ